MDALAGKLAWGATLFCMFLSAQIANKFLRNNPRLFTVMALLACAWALLLPTYTAGHQPIESPTVAAVGGFLLIYIGGILLLQAQHEMNKHDHDAILQWQVIGLFLLGLIAIPSVPLIFEISVSHITQAQAGVAIIVIMDLVGFGSIIHGSRKLFSARWSSAIALVLICYAAFELIYIYQHWPKSSENPVGPAQPDGSAPKAQGMSDTWKYIFAISKIAFTAVFGFAVAYHEMLDADRRKGPWHWTLMLVGLRNANRNVRA